MGKISTLKYKVTTHDLVTIARILDTSRRAGLQIVKKAC